MKIDLRPYHTTVGGMTYDPVLDILAISGKIQSSKKGDQTYLAVLLIFVRFVVGLNVARVILEILRLRTQSESFVSKNRTDQPG